MAKKASAWLILVKKKYKEVIAEGKLKGVAAMKEAMARAKVLYAKMKKGGPEAYEAGLAGRKIRSKGMGRGEGRGEGRGPRGFPIKG